jgi:type I restriction enzyme M protein
MNLAVHGLEGDIQKAITYYEDPHELLGKADFVMANPPFNVDEIDADKVKTDPRLPFGLPGVNNREKVSNGNYVWISYFWSYLSAKGRAGFVMSSQASSAGRDEAKVRQKLIETGDVEAMIAIRSNFFYTRTVPCELWFLNRAKPKAMKNKVLMIDARNVYRKVTRKIYDFSPEQQQNLLAIVWLYRGQSDRFLKLVSDYLGQTLEAGQVCIETTDVAGETVQPLSQFVDSIAAIEEQIAPFLKTHKSGGRGSTRADQDGGGSAGASPSRNSTLTETLAEFRKEQKQFTEDVDAFQASIAKGAKQRDKAGDTNATLNKLVEQLGPVAESSRDLIKQADLVYKLATRLIEICETECNAKESEDWVPREIVKARKAADELRGIAVEKLKQVRYFWKQAHWLTERFPTAELCDVPGLVKLVDCEKIENEDWSLTPGRYVGVAPEEVDEDFDFEETLREIHVELEDLNTEAVTLAATIKKNFEELGI